MTESELNGLLDAHDGLVKAFIDSTLTFSEFVSAYGDFPHNYALDGDSGTAKERAMMRRFGKRIVQDGHSRREDLVVLGKALPLASRASQGQARASDLDFR